MKKVFFVSSGPNHLFKVNWDIESQERLCFVRLMVRKQVLVWSVWVSLAAYSGGLWRGDSSDGL
jgi:hypothetical protein